MFLFATLEQMTLKLANQYLPRVQGIQEFSITQLNPE